MALLAIDPGDTGWLSVLGTEGVWQVIPMPSKVVNFTTASKKNRKRSAVDFNYTVAASYVADFKRWCRRTRRRPIVVYESSNPRPFQSVNSTRTQIVGIEMWPILAEAYRVECFAVDSGQWKRPMRLSSDKQKSLTQCQELCPELVVENRDGMAESVLLGYYFLRDRKEDYG